MAETKLSLLDDGGVFLETDVCRRLAKGRSDYDELCGELEESNAKNEELEAELAQVQERLATVGAEEVQTLKVKLQEEKVKAKQAWRMYCAQASEQEALLNEDTKVAILERKLAARSHEFVL